MRGKELPAPASAPGEGARDCWYRVKDLLEASRGGKGDGDGDGDGDGKGNGYGYGDGDGDGFGLNRSRVNSVLYV